MNNPFENIRNVRKHLLQAIEELSVDQLNEVPAGFNNNIIWNLAHLIAAQQGICYVRSILEPVVDTAFCDTYKPGTKPERYIKAEEVKMIKEILLTSIDRFETDYQNKIFTQYTSVTLRYGVTLNDIEDALQFLPFHEGVHTGCIWALKRIIRKE